VRDWLCQRALWDGLLLLALALWALPLVPAQPIEALGGIRLRPLAALALVILAMQAAGQLALRWLGPRHGLLATGFVAGFASSTAAVASFGGRARDEPLHTTAFAGAASLSGAATWLQMLALSATVSADAAWHLVPAAAVGAASCALAGGWLVWRGGPVLPASGPAPHPTRSALRPREALAVVLMLGTVAVVVGLLQQRFGSQGLLVGVALAALADAHAPVATLAALHAAHTLPAPTLVGGAVLAVAVNTFTRCIVAATAGGRAYALRVAAALVGSTLVAAGVAGLSVMG
jgi:uncharacterized membrane protein (DUF4010 family)